MRIKRFEELEAWQEARVLVKMVYDLVNGSDRFKKDYRLCSQTTDAAVSTMSNIAEGFSRRSNKEFIQFLFISKSSAFDKVYNQADKVSQIDSGLTRYLRNNAITQ